MGFNVVQAALVRPVFGLNKVGFFTIEHSPSMDAFLATHQGKQWITTLRGYKDYFKPTDGASVRLEMEAPEVSKKPSLIAHLRINNAMGALEKTFRQGEGAIGTFVDGLFGKAGMIWRVLVEARDLIKEQRYGGRYV